jgi:hypothetical protein
MGTEKGDHYTIERECTLKQGKVVAYFNNWQVLNMLDYMTVTN